MEKLSKIDISEIKPEDYLKWDKEKFIQEKIEKERTNNWYKQKYRKNIALSFWLSIVTLIFVTMSVSFLKVKSSKVETYLTMTNGEVIKYSPKGEDLKNLKEAVNTIRKRRN